MDIQVADMLNSDPERNDQNMEKNSEDHYAELEEQVIANFQKPNLPNVNVPERIIICLDMCYDGENTLYKLGDGTTFKPTNMLKRILDFFINTKHAINKRTEFALITLKENEPIWEHNFTNNVKDIINAIDYVNEEQSTSESFDFNKIFEILKQRVELPEYKQENWLIPPPYVVRMIVLYNRSNCIPIMSQEDSYFNYLKKQQYFYTDILLCHEELCAINKCEEVYDALQDLDNGYSYVFEVGRNATKIHEYIAKLLAHPLQRPLQKNSDYTFGNKY